MLYLICLNYFFDLVIENIADNFYSIIRNITYRYSFVQRKERTDDRMNDRTDDTSSP